MLCLKHFLIFIIIPAFYVVSLPTKTVENNYTQRELIEAFKNILIENLILTTDNLNSVLNLEKVQEQFIENRRITEFQQYYNDVFFRRYAVEKTSQMKSLGDVTDNISKRTVSKPPAETAAMALNDIESKDRKAEDIKEDNKLKRQAEEKDNPIIDAITGDETQLVVGTFQAVMRPTNFNNISG